MGIITVRSEYGKETALSYLDKFLLFEIDRFISQESVYAVGVTSFVCGSLYPNGVLTEKESDELSNHYGEIVRIKTEEHYRSYSRFDERKPLSAEETDSSPQKSVVNNDGSEVKDLLRNISVSKSDAYITDEPGTLKVSCTDYAVEFWGGRDYEFTYTFDRDNKRKLLRLLHAEGLHGSSENMIIEYFGKSLDKKSLRQYCEEHGIKYEYDSWLGDPD